MKKQKRRNEDMKYKVAIFDMDGTILDTLEDLKDSVNYCLNEFGYPQRTIAEVKSFVGNGIHKLLDTLFVLFLIFRLCSFPIGNLKFYSKAASFIQYFVHDSDKLILFRMGNDTVFQTKLHFVWLWESNLCLL